MMGEFEKLLGLRFDDKNRRMIELFTQEKQKLNARGLIISSMLIEALHKVLQTELKESCAVIVTTAIDVISSKGLLPAEKALQDMCSEALSKRKGEIEALYLSNVSHIEQGLQNKAMIQPYMSLGDFYLLQREEMRINLSSAYEKYKLDRGGTLARIIGNKFLNIPVVAWGAIVIIVIVAIAGFAGAIGGLRNSLGWNG